MRPPRVAVSVVTVVLASLVIGMVGYAASVQALRPVSVALKNASTPSPTGPAPESPVPVKPGPILAPPIPQPPIKPSFYLLDVDIAGVTTAWALLSNCAQQVSQCQYVVMGTADGGRSWTSAVQVGPSFASSDGDAPRNITVIDQADFFVYGHRVAYVTNDVGKTWRELGFSTFYYAGIAAAAGTAWVVSSPCGKGVVCQLEVRSTSDSGHLWSAPHLLPSHFSPENLAAFPSGVIMSGVPSGDLVMTSDGGTTWTSILSRCTGNPFRGLVASANGKELWELCLGYPNTATNSADKALFVSEDSGNTWTQKASAEGGGALPLIGWLPVLRSNQPHRAFLAGTNPFLVSRDSGSTWTPLGFTDSQLSFVRFAGADEGWAVAGGSVWTTSDGGDNWVRSGGALPTGG